MLSESRVNLVRVIRDGIPEREYVPGCDPWLLAGRRYLIPAPAGTGKSLFALIVATAVVRAGGVAVILDVENGSEEYARRLDDMLRSAGDETLTQACDDRLHYHEWPNLSLRWSPADWAGAVAGADVVIIDSSRLVLTAAGLDENSSDDYATLVNALVMPLFKARIATIVLDNTGHNGRTRGTTAKPDLNEVVYMCSAKAQFDHKVLGELRLERRRTRFPELPLELRVPIGAGVYGPIAVGDQGQRREPAHLDPSEKARVAVRNEVQARPGVKSREVV